MDDIQRRLSEALEGRYRIEREIGSGAMATVYLAEDLRLSRKVALKVLRPELADSLSAERFPREVEVSAGLDHPHIVSVYDSGEAAGLLFYTMTYVEGETLRQRLDREGQLPVDEVVRITREVASALQYAHERGIIHRDVKPANILLHGGHALVADFGVARAVSVAGGERLTRTGLAVGSPLYMSPEQAAGEESLDGRSDQYSLACVVYEMLAGEPPLGGRTLQTIMARRTTESPTSLQAIRTTVTAALESVVFHALDRTRADRFKDIRQFAEALAEADRSAAAIKTTGSASVARGATDRAGARWRGWAVATVGIAVLALGYAGYRAAFSGSEDPVPGAAVASAVPGLAVLPFDFLGPESGDAYVAEGAAMKLAEAFVRTGVPSPGWATVQRYRDSVPALGDLGRMLNVEYILTGQVLYRGGPLDLSVELYRANDGQVIWRETFTGVTRELTDFEHQIAQTAVDSVARYAGLPLGQLVVRRYTEDPVADSLYRRALYLAHEDYTREGTVEQVELVRKAIARDSMFAPAYVLLAAGLSALSRVAWDVPPDEQAPRIREALERALEIDPTLALAKAQYGWYYYVFEGEWEASQAMLEQAIASDPVLPDAYSMLSFPLMARGRTDSALATVRRASELDPYNPLWVSTECWMLYLAHRFQEAVDRCQFVVDSISADYGAAVEIGATSRLMVFLEGDPSQDDRRSRAQETYDARPSLESRVLSNEIGVPVKLAMLGQSDLALEVLDEELVRSDVRPLRVANTYAWLGDMDEAWAWLERARAGRDPNLNESAVRAEMEPFRRDVRWAEFARSMRLD